MNEHESFLPYNLPDISDVEVDAVVDALRSGWLAPGPRVKRFEDDFAAYTGAKHAIALDSATAGMHLALVASGIGAGDEVISTPTTFAATINVAIHTGATPVLADIDMDDFCIDPAAIERAITPRTKAIMPVHHGGSACRMDAIMVIARKHKLLVVEDARTASVRASAANTSARSATRRSSASTRRRTSQAAAAGCSRRMTTRSRHAPASLGCTA